MNRPTATGRGRGTSWERLCAHGARLPGVTQGVCYGTPALYVRKKFLARLKEDGDTVAIRSDFGDRDVLLAADPRAFYLTDHYRPYPAVLMRLEQVREAVAAELLELAWRRAAPKRLLLEHPPSSAVKPRNSRLVPRRTLRTASVRSGKGRRSTKG